MTSYGTLETKATKFQTRKQTAGLPKNSIKKLTVLFTDIVGSSKYFKANGDVAGRRMLQIHQDIASSAIVEHGGDVLKIIGDSVMAYFLNTSEALKAAIKIQQRFGKYNQNKPDKDHIRVRVCLHFGDGIVEDNDIYGDVVNMAAKFLPFAHGSQIFISNQARKQVKNLSFVNYQPVKLPADIDTLKGLEIFQVIWKESASFDSLAQNLVYLRPLWNLGKQNFRTAWDSLIKEIKMRWPEKIERESSLDDKSHVLTVREPSSSLEMAKHVIDFLRLNLGWEGTYLLPIQIVLDRGFFVRANRLALDDLIINWEVLEPGEIYLSSSTYEAVKEFLDPGMSLSPAPGQSKAFYKLSLSTLSTGDSHLFLYQNAMIRGNHTPCFYCGDQRHANVDCPSKQITEITNSFNQLGYMSLHNINTLFYSYLTGVDSSQGAGPGVSALSNPESKLAHLGFYDLKAAYQLRFLRALWNIRDDNWDLMKERKVENRDQGGMLWIGLDCLRVGNLAQAQSILAKTLEKHPEDFRVHCLLGFLYIDRQDCNQAKTHFKEALSLAKTAPQKIFILFLLQRIAILKHDINRAEKTLRHILLLHPFCSEAIYQGLLIRFKNKEDKGGLQQLVKLISRSREYFVLALIDPELSGSTHVIHPKLEDLLDEVREEANILKPKAALELERLTKFLGKEDRAASEAQSLMQKIEELSKTDSFFGYLDIIQYGESIINLGGQLIENRKKKMSRSTSEVRYRITVCQKYIKQFPFPSMVLPVSNALKSLHLKLEKHNLMLKSEEPEQFKKALPMVQEIEKEVYNLENRLMRLDTMGHLYQFLIRFFKRSIFLQSANLFVGLIIFPIIIHYLTFIFPDLQISPQNSWYYQKMAMFLGGALGIILAVVISPQKRENHFRPAREVTI